MALILLAFSSLLMAPALNLAGTSLKYHQRTESNVTETYAADAGVEYCLCMLGNNPDAYQDDPLQYTFTLSGRSVETTAQHVANNIYKITSVATTTDINSSTTIECYVAMLSFVFDYGMVALDGDINISGNSEVTSSPDLYEGDVYANGDINLSGNAEINGDATATGNISVTGNASIEGVQDPNYYPPQVFAEIDTSLYLDEANQGTLIEGDLVIDGLGYYELGPVHITGNLIISGNTTVRLMGTVYVDGTITMSGNSRIEGSYVIVAEGDIQLTGNSMLDLDDIPVIVSTDGNITVTGNNWTSAVLYAPVGDIILTGNSKVYGSVVGTDISAAGNSEVRYPTGLRDRGDLPGYGGPDVLTYTIS